MKWEVTIVAQKNQNRNAVCVLEVTLKCKAHAVYYRGLWLGSCDVGEEKVFFTLLRVPGWVRESSWQRLAGEKHNRVDLIQAYGSWEPSWGSADLRERLGLSIELGDGGGGVARAASSHSAPFVFRRKEASSPWIWGPLSLQGFKTCFRGGGGEAATFLCFLKLTQIQCAKMPGFWVACPYSHPWFIIRNTYLAKNLNAYVKVTRF